MSHQSFSSRTRSLVAAATVLVFAAACSEVAGPKGSSGGEISASGGSLTDPHVTVCVDAGSPAGTYEYDQSADTDFGTFFTTAPFSLSPGDCVDVWQDDEGSSPSDPTTNVTVTEIATAEGASLDEIQIDNPLAGTSSGSSATVRVNQFHGALVTFVHVEEPTGGGQGCTPGYWKQPQHADSWEGHAPGDLLGSVFTLPADLELKKPEKADPDEITLLEGLKLRGGGVNALIRHSVAALLNASSSGVSYDLSEADVISAFEAAVDGGDVEGTKDELEGFNEQGCPLD